MMKISIKREQSQAGLSFAERLRVGEPCSGMRENRRSLAGGESKFRPQVKNKLFLLLALLLTAATGAWAGEEPQLLTTINASINFMSGSKTFDDKVTVTFSDYVYYSDENGWYADASLLTVAGTNGYTITSCKFYTESGDAETGYTIEGVSPSVYLSDGSVFTDANQSVEIGIPGVKKIEVYGTAPSASASSDAKHLITATYREQTRSLEQPLPYATTIGELYEAVSGGQSFSDLISTMSAVEMPLTGITSRNTSVVSIGELNGASTPVTVIADGEATISIKFGSYALGIFVSAISPLYAYMKDGVKDADKWTVKVGEGQAQALPIGGLKGDGKETVTLQYNGRLKVKGVKATSEATAAAEPIEVLTYSFDDASHPSGLTAGSRVAFDYSRTSVITNSKFLNAYSNTNGDPSATTVSLGDTDLSGETWTLSFEWAACGGCNSKADHTTLKAGNATLFDLNGNSNWNTTVTIIYTGSDGTKTLPVPACDKSYRWTEAVGDQYNTTTYWHHIVVTGSAEGVKMTITNSSTGAAVVEDVVLSETNVNPTSLIIEPCCGGGIGIDALSLTYEPTAAPSAKPAATVTTAPTGAAVVGVGKTTALVSGGVAEGGTMMYKVTTENTKPASTDGFSEAVPKAQGITASGKVYVWYYVKGDDTHSDSEIAATAIEVPVADVVWDATNATDIYADGYGNSYEKEGVTLSGNEGEVYAWWDYGGINFSASEIYGYTFTAPTGKAFTKIEMKAVSSDEWDSADLGTGWAFNNLTVTWTGSAASTVKLLTDDVFAGAPVNSIGFYLVDAE